MGARRFEMLLPIKRCTVDHGRKLVQKLAGVIWCTQQIVVGNICICIEAPYLGALV